MNALKTSILNSGLEVCIYDDNSLSIKDLQGDLDISDSKWNFVFDFIIGKTSYYYFLGEHLDFVDNGLESTIDFLSEEVINSNNYYEILLKLKPTGFLGNRQLLSKLWSYYEYPAIIFMGNNKNEKELIKMCATSTYEAIAISMENTYLVHRNFEYNVLWIKKSFNMPSLNRNF